MAIALGLNTALLISACGSGDVSEAEDSMAQDSMSGGGSMEMNMGDINAVRADEVEGAELKQGRFELLDTRPNGYDDVAGTAFIARHDAGTTVTVEVSGLIPGMEYVSHVHAGECALAGGDHYQFEVGGPVTPPNEIHLNFVADDDGNGVMTAENDMVAGSEASSHVIHPADLADNKIACATFS